MNQLLDTRAAINAIRTAFNPLICVVVVYGNDTRVRFRVLAPNKKPVFEIVNLPMRTMLDPSRLREEIESARTRVMAKGFELPGWNPPK